MNICNVKNLNTSLNGDITGMVPVVVNGKTHEARIRIKTKYDEDVGFEEYFEDTIYGEDEVKEMSERLRCNMAMIALVIVEVTVDGIDGSDSLGGCWIESPDDLYCAVNEHEMIDSAIEECQKNVENFLKKFA